MPKFGQKFFTSPLFAESDFAASFGYDAFSRGLFTSPSSARQMDFVTSAAGASGLPANYQPVESAWDIPGPNALVDGYTAASNTTGTLVVDGAHVLAASDTPGDNDWFKVTLTAGQTYQFGQYARAGGLPGTENSGVPLADAYLEIYDSTGKLLAIADGGGPNTPQGLDALMTFEATYSGIYYVNATSYDNTGDGIGDFAGNYEIFAKTATGTTYTTQYDISSPLHSIDWGGVLVNREHVSVRNPDGMEGPRPTGQTAANPATVEGNALGHPGKNVIYLYFAGEGDIYANADSTIPAQVTAQNPYQYEIRAMLTAAAEFSKVADVVFISNYTLNPTTNLYERDPNIQYKPGPLGPEAGIQYAAGVDDDFDADFFYWSYPGTPGPGISLLGSMNPPDNGDEGVAQFNSADERWSAQMLQQGGFSFVTLIHEFGHGMGLAHPHDTGGGSSIMQGVVTNGIPGDDGGAGAFDLNQGINTMMSYNDGWEKSPYGQAETNNEGFGWLGGLMALDIAVIQDKYGVNEDWATGNDTYVLKDANEAGVYIDAATGQPAVHNATNAATARDGYYQGQSTFYSSIWDAGGVDQIVYSGSRDTNIDLRPATLKYEYGGAGWMSYATGIHGGYTIANGVTIENATSGSGNDTLRGNASANRLDGGNGNDTLIGDSGDDALYGGGGVDRTEGGLGNDMHIVDNAGDVVVELADEGTDTVATSINYTLGANLENLQAAVIGGTAALSLTGNGLRNFIWATQGDNVINGGGGADFMIGYAGNDFYFVDNAGDTVYELAGGGTDTVATSINHILAANVENLQALNIAGSDPLALTGNDLRNYIWGTQGNNVIDGAGGADVMIGYGGNDFYFVDNAGDLTIEDSTGGSDTVAATADYRLGANIENLQAANIGGTAALKLTGNELSNYIWGTQGDNVIAGGGGNDRLFGYAGADRFLFDTAPAAGNWDWLGDFQAGTDKIALDNSVFTALGADGALAAGAFAAGPVAADADDRIIFNSANGYVYYDADGNGAGTALLIAVVPVGQALTAADFLVV